MKSLKVAFWKSQHFKERQLEFQFHYDSSYVIRRSAYPPSDP